MSAKKPAPRMIFPVTDVEMVRSKEVLLEKEADTCRSNCRLLSGAVTLNPFHATNALMMPVTFRAGRVKVVR